MKKFCFVHTSDLHLDSPFKGVFSQSEVVRDTLRSATFAAFDSLVQLCIDREVLFLLVAGDVYDGADRSLRAQLKFLDGLERLAENNIQTFVAHGNHDPLDGWTSSIKWPDQVHIFGGSKVETKTVRIDEEPVAAVSGISFRKRNEQRNLALKFNKTDADLFQVGVLHCNCGTDTGHETYAPCKLDDLTKIGLDYWALGHVHEKRILCTDPYVVYSGNTQGLNIREPDERGCYLVTVSEDRHINLEFCPIDAVRWFSVEIGIDDVDSMDILDSNITKAIDSLREYSRPVICRIFFTGRGPLYKELRRENSVLELLERARQVGLSEEPFVWTQAMVMNCRPEIDLEKRRLINDLLGQVLHVSNEAKVIVANGAEHELGAALAELYENRRAVKLLEPLSPDKLKEIIQEAELLCVDLLETDQ